MKTASLKLTILATAIFLANPGLAFASSLSLSPVSGTFNSNCAFNADVILNTADINGANPINTAGTDVILFYDATKLNVTTIKNGTIFNDYPVSSFDPQAGKITISGLDSNQGQSFSGKGTFATISFTVAPTAQAGATQVTFDFDPNNPGKTTDSNVADASTLSDTLNHVDDGAYTIGTGTGCGPSSSPAPIIGRGGTPSGILATPAANLNQVSGKSSGAVEGTMVVAVLGSLLTVFGIAGLALL